ncbi:MAG TPA: hypothetical protein VH589_19490 [Trebonia sp.]|jgi:hypothetical protein
MAWWAVDLAARQGVPWVRRHAQVPQVAAYGQAQGFTLVRDEQRTHARLYMLARKAERLDSLARPVVQGRNARAAWSSVITSTSFDHGSSL